MSRTQIIPANPGWKFVWFNDYWFKQEGEISVETHTVIAFEVTVEGRPPSTVEPLIADWNVCCKRDSGYAALIDPSTGRLSSSGSGEWDTVEEFTAAMVERAKHEMAAALEHEIAAALR